MEHFIKEIRIEKLRHLSNITISLNPENRQHLVITGKNGSGKTSLLLAMQKYMQAINDGRLNDLTNGYLRFFLSIDRNLESLKTDQKKYKAQQNYETWIKTVDKYKKGIDIWFSKSDDIDLLYKQGDFITAFFPASRKTQIIRSHGVEEIKLDDHYGISSDPGTLLCKYMVHLKTQQAYARNEEDRLVVDRIQNWFDRFVGALRILLGDDSLTLEYDYKEYNFKVHEKGRVPFGLDELSDGYSSVIHIVSDLILRMDRNWLLRDRLSEYDIEGIVLIDELETHLHIELQKKILPFLIDFFPRIQFIVTTHSPYILNSVSNAKAYDLEKCIELENTFVYSSDELAEGYFDADEYSNELKKKIEQYRLLVEKSDLTDDERAERAKLRSQLKNIPRGLCREARDLFEEIESEHR